MNSLRGDNLHRIDARAQRQAEVLAAYAQWDLGRPVREFLGSVAIKPGTFHTWIYENQNGFRDRWREIQQARRRIPLDLLEERVGRLISKTFRDAMGEVHAACQWPLNTPPDSSVENSPT